MNKTQKEQKLTTIIKSLNLTNEKADEIIALLREMLQKQNK